MENSDFDPEFSEYSPAIEEFKNLKNMNVKKNFKTFIRELIEKLTTPIYMPNE